MPLQINSEFQTFKHIECLAPGELMRAHRPLEATVAIHPTLVLTNALPYDMDIVVWQVQPRPSIHACIACSNCLMHAMQAVAANTHFRMMPINALWQ